jgi:aspartate-semialdehyde dehydrogenase
MGTKKKLNVAVVGATGMVGNEMVRVLEERKFPVDRLVLLASDRSQGVSIRYKEKEVPVDVLTPDSFQGIHLALFSAGAARSLEFGPIAVEAGAVVVDNSSAFRMNEDVPLVVPEVNLHALKKHNGLIANPNCSTIQMVVAVNPIHKAATIRRIVVSTYQAVSGTGKEAVEELTHQTLNRFNFKAIENKVYPHQISFNVLPHIDAFLDNGYTKEEMKMINETRKIMEDDTIQVCPTTVRVPVFFGHSEAVNVETARHLTREEVWKLLKKAPGVTVVDDPKHNKYPTPLDCSGKDDVFVGRIREDGSVKNGINLWVVSDNVRKGAALNAVQIAERLFTG